MKSSISSPINIETALLDGDLPRLLSRSLGNGNAEDTVLQAGLDVVLVDTVREAEGTVELANGALSDPELGLRLVLLVSVVVLNLNLVVLALVVLSGRRGGLGRIIFDGGLVAIVVVVLDGGDAAGGGTLDGGGRGARGVGALNTTLDDEGVGISELNVHILLIDAGKLAVELVGVLDFADIELGLEGLDGGMTTAAGTVRVVIVEQAEERGEVTASELSRKERHGSCGLTEVRLS